MAINTKILDYLGVNRKSLSTYPMANIISLLLPQLTIPEAVCVASECIDFFSMENANPVVLIVYPDIAHVIHSDLTTEVYLDILDHDNKSLKDGCNISIVNVPDYSQIMPMFRVNTSKQPCYT
jgi:hypothetical protein